MLSTLSPRQAASGVIGPAATTLPEPSFKMAKEPGSVACDWCSILTKGTARKRSSPISLFGCGAGGVTGGVTGAGGTGCGRGAGGGNGCGVTKGGAGGG